MMRTAFASLSGDMLIVAGLRTRTDAFIIVTAPTGAIMHAAMLGRGVRQHGRDRDEGPRHTETLQPSTESGKPVTVGKDDRAQAPTRFTPSCECAACNKRRSCRGLTRNAVRFSRPPFNQPRSPSLGRVERSQGAGGFRARAVRSRLSSSPHRCNALGFLHRGAIATPADTAIFCALHFTLEAGRRHDAPDQGVRSPRHDGAVAGRGRTGAARCCRSPSRLGQPCVPAVRCAAWVAERGNRGHAIRFTEPVISGRRP